MESIWKTNGIHVEKVWNPCGKTMESIHHSMESIHQKYGIHPPFHGIHPPFHGFHPPFHGFHPPFHGIHLEFVQSIPPSMDSTWNNPGRVKYWCGAIITMHCWSLHSLPWLGWWSLSIHKWLWSFVCQCGYSLCCLCMGSCGCSCASVGTCHCGYSHCACLLPGVVYVLWMVVICGQLLSSLS